MMDVARVFDVIGIEFVDVGGWDGVACRQRAWCVGFANIINILLLKYYFLGYIGYLPLIETANTYGDEHSCGSGIVVPTYFFSGHGGCFAGFGS